MENSAAPISRQVTSDPSRHPHDWKERAGRSHPPALTSRSAIRKIVEIPDVKQKLISQGADPETNTPEEFAKYVKSEMAKWGKVVRDTGASAN